jgi:hypothetical protein
LTPNLLARAAVIAWPAICIAIYAARRHKSLARTTAWMVLLPAMFLPAALVIDLPGLPDLNKHRAAFIGIGVSLELFHPVPLLERLRAHRLARIVLFILIVGVVQTARTNGDALFYGPTVLPALGTWDALSLAAGTVLDVYLPFAIGERIFRTERDLLDLLEVLALCGLIYAPLAVVEVVLSPQLHRWIYGYHQHSFFQHIRAGGYRPMLFMSHGLSVALFAFMALQAAVGLARARVHARLEAGVLVAAPAAMLIACKSMASGVYGVVGTALQYLLSERARARVITGIAVLVLAYPVLRMERVFPTQTIVRAFATLSTERAASLAFRFDQEERLLARAQQRPLFGWGGWGRPHIFAPWGQQISISDGAWVILFGEFGYVGFAGFVTLLVAPLLRFVRTRPRLPARPQILVGALALILAVCALDLLPNGRLDNLSSVYAGALFALADPRRWAGSMASRGGRGPPPDDGTGQASGAPRGRRSVRSVRTHSRGGPAAPVAER